MTVAWRDGCLADVLALTDVIATRPPRVSVVTPAYNVAPYLAECVRSVLAQTVTDLELILIDDGSTDATGEIADRLSEQDARVRVIHRPNRGVSAARNVGLSHARGAFVAFIDADDGWAATFLAEQLAILARRPDVAVVTGNALNRGGGALDGHPVRSWPTRVRDLDVMDFITRDDVLFIMSVFRREVYERIGGLDETLHHSEDYHFWFRAAVAGFRFVANPAPLGWYRRRQGSASSDETAMIRGIIRVFGECRRLCEVSHPRAAAAFGRQIARFERRSVWCRARRAMLEGNAPAASACLREWRRLRGGAWLEIVLLIWRLCPQAVIQVYLLRQRHGIRGHGRSGIENSKASPACH